MIPAVAAGPLSRNGEQMGAPTDPGWRMDGYVICPACDRPDDGAAVFGDNDPRSDDPRDWGLFDGLVGTCTMCGASVRLRLEIASRSGE